MTEQALAIAMGDPAGIGPEVIAKSWAQRVEHELPPFFAVGDSRAVERVWSGPVARLGDPSEAIAKFDECLPVLNVEDAGEIVPGVPDGDGARCALHSLELAVGLVRSGAARALVTGPVSKTQLYGIGFQYPGQTEFVAERCGIAGQNAVMMLAGPSLKVVPITTHVPLSAVAAMLTVDLIVAKGRATARGLARNFGILRPRLAFAGFNPHAGENGALGREEIEVLEPAIAQLRSEGIEASGPYPADTMFHPRARAKYDAALCCYHDQALVPLKTLHFDEGVNITLGLPLVRTSPDHGTAFDIAGTDQADPGAMIAAIAMAGAAAAHRAASGS
ncbi:4-hydroxythreonine-4-phosphate dehydrogenase PdxA [Sphingomonas aracearum]|uniref:4-hydroxythreonine-4-phosphate dehydrogenase n=1 Tax=Sphingomonas aracearum TaxID=2283317 RepID=A0A369VW73_9SPHN|nr:4-hydroxythreonine-4-phosphate dehydrogenase PdxA [Sphingomonas aracearum]RDE06363.1 4-hydroxythreonine-4-phosphate dehydrogenase PdxA [Sphingomonas aracearum]